MGKRITNILLIFSLGVFLFGCGYKIGEYKTSINKIDIQNYSLLNTQPSLSSNKTKNLDFSLFWETWDKIEQKFIDKKKINSQKMFYGAIKGMVASLEDPYTFFLSPDENKQSKDDLKGRFEGIGAQLGLKDGQIIIIAPLKNSPSQRAGIKAGDFIVKVNNQSTKGWTLPQAVSKIRGPKGTTVRLTIQRGSLPEFTKDIVREQINIASVELSYEKDVAYLKLNQFGENTAAEWDKAVDEIKNKWLEKKIKGLILDLRDNPGGYLEGSVYLASEFIPEGKLVVRQESTTTENKDYNSMRTGNLLDIPMVVLINKGSASASEILSGALRDYGRATLVGEKTFGKGSVQEALELKDGAGLHITVAKWILPKGDWINGTGIEPKIKIENQIKDGNTMTRDQDKQLNSAIEELLK